VHNCFGQDFVKFPPNLSIFAISWKKDGKNAKIMSGALTVHLI